MKLREKITQCIMDKKTKHKMQELRRDKKLDEDQGRKNSNYIMFKNHVISLSGIHSCRMVFEGGGPHVSCSFNKGWMVVAHVE